MNRKYTQLVLSHKRFVLLLCLLITLLSFYVIQDAVIASSITKLFFNDSHGFRSYKKLVREFASDEILAVAFEDKNILSNERFAVYESIVDKITEIPEIRRVDSLINAENIKGNDSSLEITPYKKLLEKAENSTEELQKEILENPFYKDAILSSSGLHSAMLIELVPDDNRPVERSPEIVDEIIRIFLDAGFSRSEIHLAGLQAQISEVVHQSYLNIMVLFPFTILFLFIVVYALFRQITPVLITMSIAFISVIWTVAFGVLLDKEVNIMMTMVPAIVLIVSFSDVIHLCSAYILELDGGLSKKDAILKSSSEVGRACFYTSITTFVGFASMSFVPTPVFKQLGVVLGFGVAIALILAMTLVPVLFYLMKKPLALPSKNKNSISGLINTIISICQKTSLNRPFVIIFLFLVLLVTNIYGISRITVETDFSKRLDENNHIRIAEKFFAENFSGTNFVDIFLETNLEEGLLEPETLHSIFEFQKAIEAVEGVDQVVSFLDLLAILHREMKDEPKSAAQFDTTDINDFTDTLPDRTDLIAQYLLLFEMSSDNELEKLVNFERTKMRLAVRLSDHGFRKSADIGNEIKGIAHEMLPHNINVHVNGLSYLLGDWLDHILTGQRRGLIFALLSITVMMIIALRSFRTGILSMIPNIIPLLTLGGYLGLAWDFVDSDTMIIAMIAIGLGVDDTIHFMNRLRFESKRSSNIDTMLQQTFHFSGKAIVQTTIILTIGFIPFALSDYFSTKLMGTLLPLTLISALIADLLLVPALVKSGIMKFKQ